MAEPIRKVKRLEIPEEEIIDRDVQEVKKAISDNKTAIINGIELLSVLDEDDFLMMFKAMINHRKAITKNVFTEINKPMYEGALHNLGQMLFLLGDLNLDQMQSFAVKMNRGLAEASATKEEERTSYMGMVRALKDPEVNHSMTMLLNFLRGMGKEE